MDLPDCQCLQRTQNFCSLETLEPGLNFKIVNIKNLCKVLKIVDSTSFLDSDRMSFRCLKLVNFLYLKFVQFKSIN